MFQNHHSCRITEQEHPVGVYGFVHPVGVYGFVHPVGVYGFVLVYSFDFFFFFASIYFTRMAR